MRLEGWSHLHWDAHRGPQSAHRAVAEHDVAAMRAGDVARDRETQAAAALVLIARVVEAQERLENVLAQVRRNAGAVVVDRDGQVAVIAVAGDRNRGGKAGRRWRRGWRGSA